MPEGTVSMVFNKNNIWKFGTLSVSPFDWLEASYFYYRPSDLKWEGDFVRGHFLDKGFNVKFSYSPKNKDMPNIAIGLDDFAGTGYFTREYLVITKDLNNIKFSIGMGWGKFAGDETFKNPLSSFSSSLIKRPLLSDNYNKGGSPSYDQWFRGEASLFGGFEYVIPKAKGLMLKLELDPFNYRDFSANKRIDAIYELRQKDSDINIGLSLPLNNFVTIDTSYIKGNMFNLNVSFSLTFNDKLSRKPEFNPSIQTNSDQLKSKNNFYNDLLANLNKNRLLLQTATLHENGDLDISISTSDYRNAIRSSSYTAYISNEVAERKNIDLNLISITHINVGTELNNISYVSDYINNDKNIPIELIIRNTFLDSGNPGEFTKDEFKPNVNFPVIFSTISPSLKSHIGNPEKFYFGGINLKHVSEIQFNRNLLLSSEFALPIYNNFKNTVSGSGSSMEHVRTDLVQYLKEDDLSIARMQLDYIWSPHKNIYTKLSAGIFEPMFGGFGAEFLYSPFDKNFSVGLELFQVKQRTFKQRFNFQKYRTVTGHLNIGYRFAAGIESNISFGRYLAKDDGFTVDLARTTKSGFKAGIYFSRTNVSAERFGEGSFDKGFYFQIPMDLLSKNYKGNYSTFKLAPLTRDGGAKLIHDKNLRGLIYNSTNYNLRRQWDGFLN